MIKVLLVSGYGINCEAETQFAFECAARMAELPLSVDIVHVNHLINSGDSGLNDYQVIVFPGGFSYGDDTGAGRAYALRLKNNLGLQIDTFIARKHGLILGICNGCQILVNLLEGFSGVRLMPNSSGAYKCLWTDLDVVGSSLWFGSLRTLRMPIAHQQGRFVFDYPIDIAKIALTYREDVNGSQEGAAAIVGYEGRVMAMMPHPERTLMLSQRDDYFARKDSALRAGEVLPVHADGLGVFVNILKYFC